MRFTAVSLFSNFVTDFKSVKGATLAKLFQISTSRDAGHSFSSCPSSFSITKARSADVPSLPPICSLAYFQPVIEGLLAYPVPDNYLEYLRLKLRRLTGAKIAPADVQNKYVFG
jgi:hypothetical protein